MRDEGGKQKKLRLIDRIRLGGFYKTGCIDGVQVEYLADGAFERVQAAMNLIKRWDPLRYRRLIADIHHISITVLAEGHAGQYRAAAAVCEIDERFLMAPGRPAEAVAALIVHEATHARLGGLGFGYEEERRSRVEATCLRREVAFLSRLPNTPAARQLIAGSRDTADNLPDLSNQALSIRHHGAARDALVYLGVPKWAVAVIVGAAAVPRAALQLVRRQRR